MMYFPNIASFDNKTQVKFIVGTQAAALKQADAMLTEGWERVSIGRTYWEADRKQGAFYVEATKLSP